MLAVAPPPGVPPEAFVFPSDDAQIYPEIAFPPVAGAVHETVSESTPAVAVGADGVAGTVVASVDEDVVPLDVPPKLTVLTVKV